MSRHVTNRLAQSKNNPVKGLMTSSSRALKQVEFSLEALAAKSVKIAADFTEWEKSAIEMSRAKDGVWRVFIPLPAGNYLYRFIVDGQWCDDPHCADRTPNPFGTANNTRKVA